MTTLPVKLDPNVPQDVHYVIDMALRDEQIRHAIATVKERLLPSNEIRTDSVAVVGFGPSLSDTWEEIKKFPYVISTSGAHPFLIERGIIPTWHVAVDPLPKNTVQLIGTPHPQVEYLISSTCHPDVFEHLKDYRVKLWHVFDSSESGQRLLPQGEFAIMGGVDVGIRAVAISAFLGFRNIHVFGLDGCAKEGVRHAGNHPTSWLQKYSICEYNGKEYFTTPSMLEAARQVVHEIKQMPKAKVTFYGEGLTQEMVRTFQAKETPENETQYLNLICADKPQLITPEYTELNKQLHQSNLAYGIGGSKHADTVLKIVQKNETKTVLDYGCGKGQLARALPFPIWEYDPAIPGKDESPKPADLVCCFDVLEHVEPKLINNVLSDLVRVTKQVGYFTIHTGKSTKTLADGRNAHILQHDKSWWIKKLEKFFDVFLVTTQSQLLLHVIVSPKTEKKSVIKKKNKKKESNVVDIFADAFQTP